MNGLPMHGPRLLTLALAILIVRPALAQQPHRSFNGGFTSMFTVWNVDRYKEDGTGDDVCMMTASWAGRKVNFSLRKDESKSYYVVRVLDPDVLFTYGVLKPIMVAFDGDLKTHAWSGPGSGTGSMFDLRVPEGALFETFESQLLTTDLVSVVVGQRTWTQPIGATGQAYAMLQDCLASVAVGDNRW